MRQKQLPVEWTKHIADEKEKDGMAASVRHDTLVLSRLLEIVDEKLDALDRLEETSEFHDQGYSSRQPFVNGQRRGLKDIRKLLEFLE